MEKEKPLGIILLLSLLLSCTNHLNGSKDEKIMQYANHYSFGMESEDFTPDFIPIGDFGILYLTVANDSIVAIPNDWLRVFSYLLHYQDKYDSYKSFLISFLKDPNSFDYWRDFASEAKAINSRIKAEADSSFSYFMEKYLSEYNGILGLSIQPDFDSTEYTIEKVMFDNYYSVRRDCGPVAFFSWEEKER